MMLGSLTDVVYRQISQQPTTAALPLASPGTALDLLGENEQEGAASHTTLSRPGASPCLPAGTRVALLLIPLGVTGMPLNAQLAPSRQPHSLPLLSATLLPSFGCSPHADASCQDTERATGLGMAAAAGLKTHSLPSMRLQNLP